MEPVQASAEFRVPPEVAWDFIFGERARRAVEASRMVVDIQDYEMRSDGTPRYTMVMGIGPLRMRSVSDYTVYERPRRTVNDIKDSPFGGRFFVDFEPVPGGTRVTERWDLAPPSRVVAALLPALRPVLQRMLQKDLARLAVAAGDR